MPYKIYAPVEGHNCDYGVDFIEGVGFTTSAVVAAQFEAKGYAKVSATALSQFDKLPKATLIAIAAELEVTLEEDATKQEIVAALIAAHTALTTAAENLTDLVADIGEVLADVAIVTQEGLNAAVAALIEPYEEGA